MRQVQITTEAGVSILLVILIFVLVIITTQQNNLDKSLKSINASVENTQKALSDIK